MGNAHLFLDNIILGVVSGWSVGDSEGWKSLKSVSARQTDLFFITTFAYTSRGSEGVARAVFDVQHIASNKFCDLAGLGSIRYVELTYVWR